jgi:hypothetical protein
MSQPPDRSRDFSVDRPGSAGRPGTGWGPIAAHPVTSAVIALLIIASVFFALYVPIYGRITPKIGDFPFFYFYLLVYMPAVSIALLIVIALQKRIRPLTAGPAGAGPAGAGPAGAGPAGAGPDVSEATK